MKLHRPKFSFLRNRLSRLALGAALLLAPAFAAQAAPAAASFSLDALSDNKTELLTVGPNPFTDNFRVQLAGSMRNQNVEVRVLNVIGRVVFEYNGPAAQLDAQLAGQSGRWPKGFYYLMVTNPATNAAQTLRLQKL